MSGTTAPSKQKTVRIGFREPEMRHGFFFLNGFCVLENIGKHPFADQLLMNFVRVYGE